MGEKNKTRSKRSYSVNKNGRKPYYSKRFQKGNTKAFSKPNGSIKEYRFHMHDYQARKMSESFITIKESIILKVQKTFDNTRDVANILKNNNEKVLTKPNLIKPYFNNREEKKQENLKFRIKWQVDYDEFKRDPK